jgi:hypothetical protein
LSGELIKKLMEGSERISIPSGAKEFVEPINYRNNDPLPYKRRNGVSREAGAEVIKLAR